MEGLGFGQHFSPEGHRPYKKYELARLGDGLLFVASIGGHDPCGM
jgi:hypothetical protein